MKAFLVVVILIILGGVAFFLYSTKTTQPSPISQSNKVNNMKITSSAFENNQPIPAKYTCKGEGVNPPLQFEDVPEKAKSLVFIVDDPDAPTKTFVHWVIYNMSPNITFISENSKPGNAIVALNDFGKKGYGGPCPPSGTHRYFFKLYALDEKLEELPGFADKEMIEELMQEHILDQAELIGTFSI